MDFAVEYPRLEPAQQDRFREVVTRLLSGHVLTPGPAMQPDPDWRFAERHRELIDAYLRIGGWRLEIDLGLRLCRAVHESGEQRVRLSKLESLVLCTLRLAYHEQMQQVSEDLRCEMIGRLPARAADPVGHGPPPSSPAVRSSTRCAAWPGTRCVVVDRGFAGEDTETFEVSPLIEKVLPADRIAEMAERIRAYTGAAGPPAEPPSEAERRRGAGMIRLAAIRLVNWYHFADETFRLGGSCLLLGDNGSGKSTVLDAVQWALVADQQQARFNKAANEQSRRGLYSYVRYKLGSEDETRPGQVRFGRGACASYVILHFADERDPAGDFACGIAMEATETDTHVARAHFVLPRATAADVPAVGAR